MVGDGDILVAAAQRRFRHLANGVFAVGLVGVHVEIAANIGLLNQVRQAVLVRGFDFAQFSRSSGGIQSSPRAR